MKHAIARTLLGALATLPLAVLGVFSAAGPSQGATVDGACPSNYTLVRANNDIRREVDARTGSIDGWVCALELNEAARYDRNLVDNMVG